MVFTLDVRMVLSALASRGVLTILNHSIDHEFLGINRKWATFSFWWQMYEFIV